MKKSHYLAYLNQYHNNIPLEVAKTFKSNKNQKTLVNPKINKSKNIEIFDPLHRHKQLEIENRNIIKLNKENKKIYNQNKQNQHPNIYAKQTPQILNIKNKDFKNLNSNPLKNHGNRSLKINKQNQKNDNSVNIRRLEQVIQTQKMQKYLQTTKQFNLQTINNIKNNNIVKQETQLNQIVKLNQCNFEPTHDNKNLFVVQTESHNHIIVCQRCSQKFVQKTSLSQLLATKPLHSKSKYSYNHLIQIYHQINYHQVKLQQIEQFQKQNYCQIKKKIEFYYRHLNNIIEHQKQKLLVQVAYIYHENLQKLDQLIRVKSKQMKIITKEMQKRQKLCVDIQNEQSQSNLYYNDQQINKITQNLILKNQLLSLSEINVNIPENILNEFQKDFFSSKYCLKFQGNTKYSGQENQKIHNLTNKAQQISVQTQNQKESEFIKQEQDVNLQEKNDIKRSEGNQKCLNLQKPQLQMQIPFNVQYSQQKSIKNPSSLCNRQQTHLNQIYPQDEQLLIQSIRQKEQFQNKQQFLPVFNKKSKINQTVDQNLKNNFQTEPSTYRINQSQNIQKSRLDDFSINQKHKAFDKNFNKKFNQSTLNDNEIQQQKQLINCSVRIKNEENTIQKNKTTPVKKDFVKFLHTQLNQFDDLMCDEELTLSNSHPIYQNRINKNFNKKISQSKRSNQSMQEKDSKKSINTNCIQRNQPLTLSDLESSNLKDQQKVKHSRSSELILSNSIYVGKSENKHEISFELDQNLILDGHILSVEENQNQNYDIISPAFKII